MFNLMKSLYEWHKLGARGKIFHTYARYKLTGRGYGGAGLVCAASLLQAAALTRVSDNRLLLYYS